MVYTAQDPILGPSSCPLVLQVSYDTVKSALIHLGMPDNIGLHFTAGLSAGFAATVLGSPWDVIGTRLMARSTSPGHTISNIRYHSILTFLFKPLKGSCFAIHVLSRPYIWKSNASSNL